jgi:hypothetical protein
MATVSLYNRSTSLPDAEHWLELGIGALLLLAGKPDSAKTVDS